MKLLVDIGNTRIKWATDEHGVFNSGGALTHHQVHFLKTLNQQWNKLETPDVLAIAFVCSELIANQLITLAKSCWPGIKIIVANSKASQSGVINAYQQPGKLGVDRWLGLLALNHYYSGSLCLVDCGTAITIDCLNDSGQHLGGLISPGLAIMRQSLISGTEELHVNDQDYSVGLSDHTEAAIFSGTVLSAVGLIEKAMAQFLDCNTLVLTGGDAKQIAKHINYKFILEPDLVLKGLSLYCSEENS